MFKKMMQRKLRIGRLGMPLWILGLTGGLMAAAAGQAVGPVLAGSVTGTVGATIEQTVVLSAIDPTVTAFGTGSVSGADDAVGVINDEGTNFTVAMETQVGQSSAIKLTFANGSGASANAMLELNVPVGVDVEVEETSGSAVKEAQLSSNKWLLQIPSSGTLALDIKVEPKDDLKPGFYTLTGRIVQING